MYFKKTLFFEIVHFCLSPPHVDHSVYREAVESLQTALTRVEHENASLKSNVDKSLGFFEGGGGEDWWLFQLCETK